MANINDYNPPSPPSFNVGTAGANYAPGNTFRALASDIDRVRDQYGQAKLGRTMALLGPLAKEAPFIGQTIRRVFDDHQRAKVKQTKMLGEAAVAKAADQLQSYANDQFDTTRKNGATDPNTADLQYRNNLNDRADSLLDLVKNDPVYGKDPEIVNAAENKLRDVKTSAYKTSGNWAFSQGKDNAEADVHNSGQSFVTDVSSADGTFTEKYNTFLAGQQKYEDYTNGMSPVLGSHYLQGRVEETKQKAGSAFFDNLLAQVPHVDDPEVAVSQEIPAIKQMLARSAEYGIPLAPNEKLRLNNVLKAQEHDSENQLIDAVDAANYPADFKIRQYKFEIDNQPKSARVQTDAINFAQQQVAALQAHVTKIQSDPNYPARAKATMTKALTAQVTKYDGLVNTANAHLTHQAEQKEKAAKEAQSEARHAAVEARADQREQRTEKREADAAAARQAQIELNQMQLQLFNLSQGDGPTRNAEAIQDTARQIYKKQGEMLDTGLTKNPQQGLSVLEKTSKIISGTAAARQKQLNVFDNLGRHDPETKRANGEKVMKAQTQALQNVMNPTNDLYLKHQFDQLGVASGLTSEQAKAQYSRRIDYLLERAKKEHGVTQEQVLQRGKQILSDVFKASGEAAQGGLHNVGNAMSAYAQRKLSQGGNALNEAAKSTHPAVKAVLEAVE